MNITKRKPVSVGEMLTKEFMQPISLTQVELAKLMGISRKIVNELCTNKRSITVEMALMLVKVFGNTPDFWLNTQQRNDLWKVLPPREEPGRTCSKDQGVLLQMLFNVVVPVDSPGTERIGQNTRPNLWGLGDDALYYIALQ